ncbi:MAG: heterodisulfide reductase-related iron-sulfur binding cluster [Gammaproteobacteria bacterium]
MNSPCPLAMSSPLPLSEVVREATGDNVFKCYQCIKCTSGCPLADQFDLTPNQVMRSVQLNDLAVLQSRSIWLCASCHTCTTRCPQQIDVTGVMDALRIESRKRGVKPAVAEIAKFNKIFMRSVKIFGRVYELGLMASFNMALRQPFRDLKLGRRMFARGKLSFWPHFGKAGANATKRQHNPKAIGYYPGCSLSSTSIEYGKSVKNIASAMDIELIEPENWSCCGASAAHATDPKAANVLPMSSVARIEQMGLDTVTSPCSACFSRLKHAEHSVTSNEAVSKEVSDALGYEYKGSVKVQHLLDVIVDRAGLDEVRKRVSNPLKGLKLACYYGCLITRPTGVTGADNPEYPQKMDRLVRTLGAETVDWSRKTECCGGSLGINQTKVAVKMMQRIMDDAKACGAEAIVTMCPICHLNLDSRQGAMGYNEAEEIPIFQATQLMSLAFGQGEDKAAIRNNLTDPKPYLQEKGVLN